MSDKLEPDSTHSERYKVPTAPKKDQILFETRPVALLASVSPMSDRSEVETLVEIENVVAKLGKTPNDFSLVCRLASLHLDDNKLARSKPHADHALAMYRSKDSPTLKQGIELSDMLVKFWKHDKSLNVKHDLRLNLGEERAKVLINLEDVMKQVFAKKDSEYAHLISLKMAYVKECKGEFQASLALLSDLIAAQATDNVDLSYIIFKGAILLKHVGQPKQCIEYLEFIMDDPPVQDGFAKTHVAAFLTRTYESSGDKYKVFLPKAYKDLQEAFAEDMPAASHKLMRSLGRNNFSQSSEIWEILALQALERCEYVLATEFLSEAISKAPGKPKLLHLLAEVYTLLKQKDQAVVCAEEAYSLSPQSGDLRNLLLQIAPAVWTEKLRVLVATTSIPVEGNEDANDVTDPYAPPHFDTVHHHDKPEIIPMNSTGQGVYLSAEKETAAEEANNNTWLNRMKNKASGALKAINSGTPIINVKSPDQRAKSTPLHTVPSEDTEDRQNDDKDALGGAGAVSVSKSGSGDGEEPFSPVENEKVSPKHSKQKQPAPKSPKSHPKNQVAPTTGAEGQQQDTLQETGSMRPKSRGFVSMLLSSASSAAAAASSATSAAATATANTMSSMSSKISPMKSRPPSASTGKKNEKENSPGKAKINPKTQNKATKGAPAGANKAKKVTKYDIDVHKSKLSVEEGERVAKKIEKPQISAEEKKILELVLAGNENVHIYDPNLQVLHNFRASQNKK